MATAAEAKEKRQEGLSDEAKKQQDEALAAGKKGPSGGFTPDNVVESRTKRPGATPVNGVVDNMTQRDGSDALEGHFVLIDYSKKATREFVQQQLAPEGSALAEQEFEVGTGSADYGTYLGAGEVGKDGYPVTGRVFLRDEHAAIINVPYDALRRAPAGGRR